MADDQHSDHRDQGSSSIATHIIAGDFSKLYVLERQGIELFFSEHVAFNADQIWIRASARENVLTAQPLAFSVSTGIV